MARNALLGYLDLVWKERNPTKESYFEYHSSFKPSSSLDSAQTHLTPRSLGITKQTSSLVFSDSPFMDDTRDSPSIVPDRPIHTILLDLQHMEAESNAYFFAPFILHHWQLQRLLNVLCTSTPVLALPTQIRSNITKIKKLIIEKEHEQSAEKREVLQAKISELELLNLTYKIKITTTKQEMAAGKLDDDLDNVQAVLVLSRLLNIVYRKGMSLPLLSDQLRLENQLAECRELLQECHIEFDTRFSETFSVHDHVLTKGTTWERLGSEISEDIAWIFGDDAGPDGDLGIARYYVSRVLGIQVFHLFYNNFRLGATRFRRLLAFLEPFLQNPMYSAIFKAWDPTFRMVIGYVNVYFFIPRLSLNLSILFHHLFNTHLLDPMECDLDMRTRFEAHWARIWFEVFADSYWFLVGLKVCFWLPGGALSPLGISLSLTVQFLDLFTSILRACVELYRLQAMCEKLKNLEAPNSIQENMKQRFWFEALVLGYMVTHFSILMIALCLTLPAVGAVSTLLPVIGGVTSVLMTAITYYMQNYFNQCRQSEFESGPKPYTDQEITTSHSRYFA